MVQTGRSRVLSLLAGAAALIGTATASDAATVRVVLGYYSAATQGVFEEMAKDFMSKHPGDEVKIEVISWDNLQQRLTTDIAGGTAPDIAMIGTRWLLDYVKNDVAEPMDSYITPEFKAGFIDAFLAPSTLEGKLYGLPIAASARAMYYNKDLLAKAGVNEPPTTWDGVVDTAKKIKALGGDS
ncbi:MAG: extracellular solute-binding protein, partial [Rhizobiales bacterium]|nr:extracellular solute-binding protein [Hyphomicrobiales bacterium]